MRFMGNKYIRDEWDRHRQVLKDASATAAHVGSQAAVLTGSSESQKFLGGFIAEWTVYYQTMKDQVEKASRWEESSPKYGKNLDTGKLDGMNDQQIGERERNATKRKVKATGKSQITSFFSRSFAPLSSKPGSLVCPANATSRARGPTLTPSTTTPTSSASSTSTSTSTSSTSNACSLAVVQTVLDLGQKNAGVAMCTGCGMRFARAAKEDDALHQKYHASVLGGIDYNGYTQDTIVDELLADSAKIILIPLASASAAQRKKCLEILEIVNQELGAVAIPDHAFRDCKMFLYVVKGKVVGCVVAEPIETAFRLSPTGNSNGEDENLDLLNRL
ncbi:UNVERIFIED_CONTAM: hypothetical protein HDU68_008369 [Siphonaria sp. JEL0065]|nr:hypothetical protein HDU68_008369 [Siphonaria sp. JEL0065]